MSESIIAKFFGGPLAGQSRELECLVSEYKIPTRQRYPVKFLEGKLIANVFIMQDAVYYRGAGVNGIYNFVYENPDELDIEVTLSTVVPLQLNGSIMP